MKDQDLAYIRMKRMMDAKKIERLQSSLHYLENDNGEDDNGLGRKKKKMTNRRKHTLFVEGGQEEVQQFDLAQHFETHPDLISRAFNRPRIMTLEGGAQKMDKKQGEDDDDEYDDEEGGSNSPHPHRPPPSAKQQLKAARQQRKFERSIAKARSGAYTEMEMRIERMNKLKAAEERLISEQHANAKGRKRKIVRDGDDDADGGGKRPAVYKWRRKRAR
jgi:U3 small nucleolar RNA-associated protein 11